MITPSTIKTVQDIMRKDVGVDGDAQRLGQLVWMLFLKVFDDREAEWEAFDASYISPIPRQLRWRSWAADAEGLTGDELADFVNQKLFPGFKDLEVLAGSDPRRSKLVRGVFEDAYNYMKSGTLLRQVVNVLQRDLDYNRSDDRHAFGDIYETLLRGLQSAGDAGEYYTPRPVTEFMVQMVNPRLGEKVIDPACGTGGFLLCSLNHIRDNYVDGVDDDLIAQQSILGIEKKPLPHLLCTTNMLLHGIDVPTNIRRDNPLARPLRDYGSADKVDVVVTNPPFQGTEEDGIEMNFPAAVRSRETSDLFLALTLQILKDHGRAAIVLPDSSLFGEGVKETLRREILARANLHTIVRLPYGVFSPYTDIRTNLLFFDKGQATSEVWFYELQPTVGDRYTKTKPILREEFDSLREWWCDRKPNKYAWKVPVAALEERRFNLAVPNPTAEDVEAAFSRGLATLESASGDFDILRGRLVELLDTSSWKIGPRVGELFERLSQLDARVSLTAGVVENLRVAMTGFAMRGEMSERLEGDEDIEETLARFNPSGRRDVRRLGNPPFSIPEHWRWMPLASIADFYVGRTPSTQEPRYWADPAAPEIPWVSISDLPRRGITSGTKRTITSAAVEEVFKRGPVRAGSLLMGFKLSLGKTAIAGTDVFHNEAIASFSLEDENLKHYLLWAMPLLAEYGAANPAVRGNTLNNKSVSAMWVPIAPHQEQVRVVAALRWTVEILEDLCYRSEQRRISSDRLLKLQLARSRANI